MKTLVLFLPALLCAQTPASSDASVSGMVKDSITGQPLAGYNVSTSVNATWVGNAIIQTPTTRTVQSTTDASGRYRLAGLPAAAYRIVARDAQRFGSQITRHLTLAGQDIESFDFIVAVDGAITGKVVDQNKEPVPGLTVMLVAREYHLGSLGYFPRAIARTDDRGIYTLDRVSAGQPYLLMAEHRAQQIPARSEAPLDPKLRKPVPTRTWYPNSTVKESAAPITIQPGERREGVDIEIRKSANFCAEGEAGTGTGPAALRFSIEALQPSSGISPSGGMFMASPNGTTSPDGKFRICDLAPGSYRFTLLPNGPNPGADSPGIAVATIAISDRDVRNLKPLASTGIPVEGEVVWDSTPPQEPVTAKLSFSLTPLLRTQLQGDANSVRAEIPGTFTLPNVFLDAYAIRAFFNAPGIYIKDITYAGRSVQYEPIHLGSTPGVAGFRVVMAHDGATVTARVSDKDGNPVSDSHVLILPAGAASEALLAAQIVSGQTDQRGQYTSTTLAPGKYYVAATADSTSPTPESIGRLWRARNRFQEVDLAPGGSTQLSLVPVKLE